MTVADSSLSQLWYLEEAAWGTTPAVPMKAFRFTNESLKANINRVISEEIRSDRQVADLITALNGCGGDFGYELSYGAQDDVFEGMLFNDWSAKIAISAIDIDAAAGDQSLNTVGEDFSGIAVGQWIKVGGFTTAANNGFFRVASATTTKLVLEQGAAALVTEVAGDTVTIDGSTLVNGTTKKSYSIEKEFTDVTRFLNYTGMRCGGGTLNIETGRPINGTFTFLGKREASSATTIGTGAVVPAPNGDVFNAVDNVNALRENGVPSVFDFLSMSLNVDNGLREQPAIGNAYNIGIGAGTMTVTGALRAYFSSAALYEKFLNNTPTDLAFRVTDAAGNVYIISMYRLKFSDGTNVVRGKDQDVLSELNFTSFRHPTIGKTMRIDRFDA